jgi:secreted trypsin-like serine protease
MSVREKKSLLPFLARINYYFGFFSAGWGRISGEGNASIVLKQTDLTVMNCDKSWAPSQYDTNKQICAIASESGTCKGDSGGPLMYQHNGQW